MTNFDSYPEELEPADEALAALEQEECDEDEDEDEYDGQPDEYTEWQDFMDGDEYYDHSESYGEEY